MEGGKERGREGGKGKRDGGGKGKREGGGKGKREGGGERKEEGGGKGIPFFRSLSSSLSLTPSSFSVYVCLQVIKLF